MDPAIDTPQRVEAATSPAASRWSSSAARSSAATFAALAASYVNQVVASSSFGMGASLDAYLATNAVCNLVLAAVGGSFGVAIAARAARSDHREEHAGADMLVAGALGACVAVVLALLGRPLAGLVAHQAFAAKPGLVLTVLLLNLIGMAVNVAATVASNQLVGRGRLVLGLGSAALVSLGGVAGVLLFARSAGIVALAAGTLAGATVRLVVVGIALTPSLPSMAALSDAVRSWWTNMHLVAASLIVTVVGVLDKVALAPFRAGTVSVVGYAVMLLVSSAAVLTAALNGPLVRRMTPFGDEGRRRLTEEALAVSLRYLLPVALLVVVESRSLASLLIGWGKVTAADIDGIALAMRLGVGVAIGPCLAPLATYMISSERRALVLRVTVIVTAIGVGLFFLLRPLFGPSAVPVGYSVVYLGVPLVYGALFLAEGRERTAIARRLVAAAAPGAVGAAAAALVVPAIAAAVPAPARLGALLAAAAGVVVGFGVWYTAARLWPAPAVTR